MDQHVKTVVRSCFFHLRRLRSVPRILGGEVTLGLVSTFVKTRLDYCNSVLAGLPQATIDPLQRVQNAAARLVAGIGTRDHITPVLRSLHWLPIKLRIQYKLCVHARSQGGSTGSIELPSARTWVAFSEPACVPLHVIVCEMRVHAKYASFYTVK